MSRVHVLGAAGFAGAQLAALVDAHPALELGAITARGDAGRRLVDVAPGVPGRAPARGLRPRGDRARATSRRSATRTPRPPRWSPTCWSAGSAWSTSRPTTACATRPPTRSGTASSTRGPTCWPRPSTGCPSATASASPAPGWWPTRAATPRPRSSRCCPWPARSADVVVDAKSGRQRRGQDPDREPSTSRRSPRASSPTRCSPTATRPRSSRSWASRWSSPRTWCRSTAGSWPPATPARSTARRTRTTCAAVRGLLRRAPLRRGGRAAARDAGRAAHQLRPGVPHGRPAAAAG